MTNDGKPHMPAPKVLISDALSPAAVQIFKDRGIEVDFQPNLGKDKEKLAEIIGNYDGLAIRSATKATAKILREGDAVESDRPRRHRRRQCGDSGGYGKGHHRDEHAVRQFDHHRRTRDHADAGAGARDSAGRCLHAGRQVGEEPLHGRRDHRQDAGRDRLRQYRRDRRRSRAGLAHEGGRLRSVPVAGARQGHRRREGRARRSVQARRLHHAAHAADREDQEHHRRGGAGENEEGRAHHQLRARRPGRRAGAGRCAEFQAGRGRRLRRVRRGAGDHQRAVRPSQCDLHAASWRRHHRSAGERRTAGRRTNVGLPADRRDLQCGEFSVDHRRRGAETEALHRSCRKARLVRGPIDRDRHRQGDHHL